MSEFYYKILKNNRASGRMWGRVKAKLKHFLLFPPKWIERILVKSARYRAWVIREAFKVLADAMRGGGEDG